MCRILSFVFLNLFLGCNVADSYSQESSPTSKIHLNQLGFLPQAQKIVAIEMPKFGEIFIIRIQNDPKILFEGTVQKSKYWKHSGEKVGIADLSGFQQEGDFIFELKNSGATCAFQIGDNVYDDIHKASIKSFYFQRVSQAIPEAFGGPWHRPAGHLDDQVEIHPSAATEAVPAGSIVTAPGGWYDAGDYGKYTVNAATSTAYLLALYERFSPTYDRLSVGIDKKHDHLGDLLEEIRYNLDWLLLMQEPQSGMVYHKLTSLSHAHMVMPHQDTTQRYMIGKSTAANLDFAAVMAMAARIYQDVDPVFGSKCLSAARKAWQWAEENAQVYYRANPEGVHTGDYPDDYVEDERVWAALELFLSTQDKKYLPFIHLNGRFTESPNWQELSYFSLMQMNFHLEKLSGYMEENSVKEKLYLYTDAMVEEAEQNPYRIPFGEKEYDFLIGSNSKIAGNGLVLLEAYHQSGKRTYFDVALSCLDYLLGRNPTGYCFVSGFGSKSPRHIHHRPSYVDGVDAPVPGFLVGGPNGISEEECTPKGPAAKAYLDEWCSYTTNEVTINWNAPFVALVGAISNTFAEN